MNEQETGRGRVLTLHIYLSDVEKGGETRFPELDPPLVVKPKKGSAILWSSVRGLAWNFRVHWITRKSH